MAEDADGVRRGVCWVEDRIAAGDLASCTRKPWLKHRISRCYFSPIKRPPANRDELMDDVDYYPDAYLNRLAHEGVNGIWPTDRPTSTDRLRLGGIRPECFGRISAS